MIGETIGGRYEIVRLLGQGGMGSVYEALHSGTGRRVAVKIITLGAVDPAGQLARLEIEAKAAGAIDSRHIVDVLDAGRDEEHGISYIVMEHLAGEDLHDLFGRARVLAPEVALRITAQACRGLSRAHAAGVIHRDIKPANLFLARLAGGERVVKILDFGIAKVKPTDALLGGRARVTRTGNTVGSPLYMSPEQARGHKALDHRTDLWSLGIVLYEALCGRTPHPSDCPMGELILAICTHPVPPVASFAPWVPGDIERVLARALAIDPADRYESADEMLADLAALVPEGDAVRDEMLFPFEGMGVDGCARSEVAVTVAAVADGKERPKDRAGSVALDETRELPSNATGRADHLPSPLTSFVGREREIAEIKPLIFGGTRLLSLVGPGGTGKTRLALRVATELCKAFAQGVAFVDLSPVADPTAISPAMAAALGVREEPGLPLTQTLARQLRSRHLLLVLDNCEHLIVECARLVEELLAACPRLRLLATSREALAVDGETVFPVAPLSVPTPAQGAASTDPRWLLYGPSVEVALRFEAVRLFVERARAALPGFELTEENAPAVVHICQRLDGIPLAIELAAARVRAMPVDQIAMRIRDRFGLLGGGRRTAVPRQQTLRALIDWSHDLLSAPEQALLRRLSLFSGGFTLAAAEAACAWPGDPLGIEPGAVLELLIQLVNKSLVIADLETTRVGALHSQAPPPMCVGAPHSQIPPPMWVGTPHSQVPPSMRVGTPHSQIPPPMWAVTPNSQVPQRGEARYRLLETIRHYAWEKLQASSEEATAREQHLAFFLRLAEDAEPALRGHAQLSWLSRLDAEHDNLRLALDFCQATARWGVGLRLAGALGRFWWLRGHHLEGCAWFERLFAQGGAAVVDGSNREAARSRARAVRELASLLPSAKQARPWWAESLRAYRALGDAWGITASLLSVAEWELQEGNHDAAVALLNEGLACARATRDPWMMARILEQSGRYHRARLELVDAVQRLEEGASLARAAGDRWLIGVVLLSLGLTRSFQGDHAAARALLEESLALQRSLGSKAGIAETLKSLGGALECLGEHGQAAACYEEMLTLAQSLGSEALVAGAYLNLADNALSLGALPEVRRCLREAFLRWREVTRKDQLAWSLLGLGDLARREGHPEQAVRVFAAEQTLEETFGIGLHPPARARFERMLQALRAELGARADAAWDEGRALSLEDAAVAAIAYLSP